MVIQVKNSKRFLRIWIWLNYEIILDCYYYDNEERGASGFSLSGRPRGVSWQKDLKHANCMPVIMTIGRASLIGTGNWKKKKKILFGRIVLCQKTKFQNNLTLNLLTNLTPFVYKSKNWECETWFKWKRSYPNTVFGIGKFFFLIKNRVL